MAEAYGKQKGLTFAFKSHEERNKPQNASRQTTYLLGVVLGAGALSFCVGAGAGGTGTEEALPSMTEVLERTIAFLLKYRELSIKKAAKAIVALNRKLVPPELPMLAFEALEAMKELPLAAG